MARTLEEFTGTYTIRNGQGSFGIIESGFRLSIGTGAHLDPAPDGIRVGISIVDREGRRVLPEGDHPPAFAYLVDGTLNGSTYWLDPVPQLLAYQISLYTLRLPDGGTYKAPAIIISIGDPQNAGVWGADDEGG